MIRFFFNFILIFIPIAFNAQVKEAYLHSDTFTVAETVLRCGNHIFMNQAKSQSYDLYLQNQKIIKLNFDLQKRDSLNISQLVGISNNDYVYCPKLKDIGKGRMVGIFNAQSWNIGPPNSITQKMHVVVCDSLLQVQHQFTMDWGDSVLRLLDVDYYNDSLYFVGFTADSTFVNVKNVIIKTAIDGTFGKLKTFADTLFGPVNKRKYFQTLFLAKSKILVSLGGGFDGGSRYSLLDYDFNLVSNHSPLDSGNNIFAFPASGFFVEDGNGDFSFLSSLVLPKQPGPTHPAYPGTVPYFAMGAAHLDSGLNVIKIDSFPFSGFNYGYYINPKPYFDALDYEVADSVIMIMPGQEIDYGNFSLQDSSDMYIYNYNAVTKSMNWIKVYNNGYSNGAISAAEVLPGNRYLIMLNEYNWDKYSYPNTSVHLMILDSQGSIVGNAEHPYLRNFLTVYPMPFTNELRVEGLPERAKPFTYKLYQMSGKEREAGRIEESNTIKTESLRSGSFILQILDEGRVYQNIPVVKQ